MPGTTATMPRRLVVTGATGKQGGALVAALLARPSQPFEIYAVTRNKQSPKAMSLADKPNVHVIQGELDHPEEILKQVESPWGLFSVSMLDKGHVVEEKQGKAMTKAARDAGVKHIVFTATERGGPIESDTNPTNIPHFISKFNIEQDIMERSKQTDTTWTFLRPVAFMENLSNDFLGKGFVSMWRLNGLDRKLQLISTKDIGRVAADAFLNFDTAEYRNRAISLAGDEISPNEAADVFKKVTGKDLPYTYGFVGRMLRWGLKEQLGLMFDWFKDVGFGTDVKATRKRYPFMQDFRTWVAEESAWRQK